jgi:hypothetical protein
MGRRPSPGDLRPADFARAFTALGVAAGSEAVGRAEADFLASAERDPKWATPEVLYRIAMLTLLDALSKACRLPPGTAIDVSQLRSGWMQSMRLPVVTRGELDADFATLGGEETVDAASLVFEADRLQFDRESGGASELATLADAVADARPPAGTEQRRAARRLQQQSFVLSRGEFRDAARGFVQGRPALVRVRIGPPAAQWQSLPTEFPTEQLHEEEKCWRLTVWLTEPKQLFEPLRQTVILPLEDASTECAAAAGPRKPSARWASGDCVR